MADRKKPDVTIKECQSASDSADDMASATSVKTNKSEKKLILEDTSKAGPSQETKTVEVIRKKSPKYLLDHTEEPEMLELFKAKSPKSNTKFDAESTAENINEIVHLLTIKPSEENLLIYQSGEDSITPKSGAKRKPAKFYSFKKVKEVVKIPLVKQLFKEGMEDEDNDKDLHELLKIKDVKQDDESDSSLSAITLEMQCSSSTVMTNTDPSVQFLASTSDFDRPSSSHDGDHRITEYVAVPGPSYKSGPSANSDVSVPSKISFVTGPSLESFGSGSLCDSSVFKHLVPIIYDSDDVFYRGGLSQDSVTSDVPGPSYAMNRGEMVEIPRPKSVQTSFEELFEEAKYEHLRLTRDIQVEESADIRIDNKKEKFVEIYNVRFCKKSGERIATIAPQKSSEELVELFKATGVDDFNVQGRGFESSQSIGEVQEAENAIPEGAQMVELISVDNFQGENIPNLQGIAVQLIHNQDQVVPPVEGENQALENQNEENQVALADGGRPQQAAGLANDGFDDLFRRNAWPEDDSPSGSSSGGSVGEMNNEPDEQRARRMGQGDFEILEIHEGHRRLAGVREVGQGDSPPPSDFGEPALPPVIDAPRRFRFPRFRPVVIVQSIRSLSFLQGRRRQEPRVRLEPVGLELSGSEEPIMGDIEAAVPPLTSGETVRDQDSPSLPYRHSSSSRYFVVPMAMVSIVGLGLLVYYKIKG